MLAAALGLTTATAVLAHQDPPNCAGIDSSMSLTVFRNNGSPVGGGTVTECETVRLRSSLEWQSECLIAGGAFRVGTVRAGNVFNSLSTVANPVPCLGAATVNADGCTIGQPTEVDTLTDIVYTVQAADIVAGTITFRASWENGILHQSASNVPGQSDQRQIVIPVQICNDNQFCNGVETCDPAATDGTRTGLCQPGVTPCVDNLFCSNVVCNEATDSCDTTDISTTQCPDNQFCATIVCSEATDACVTTDISTSQCPDNQFCANIVCSEASDSCVTTDISTSQCPDNDFCANIVCSEASDSCVTTDTSSSQCPDNLFCANVTCSEASDSCVTTDTSSSQCPDNLFCSDITCSEATDSCVTTDVSSKCDTDPNIPDQCELCVEASDQCVVDLTQDPICQPQELICRTPGFWGTHADADEDKNCSQDITQAVITEGGGTLNICGERIVNTSVDDAASAVEAICVAPRGNSKLQLARQLTSMALNCIVSGGTAGCGGTEIPTNLNTLFTTCNAVCAGTSTAKSVGSCISEIDCFNNGGTFGGGTCTPGGENNCHTRALPLEDLDLPNNDASAGSCFGKQGAAGSSDECSAARGNDCAVLNTTSGADEDNCGADSAP